MQHKRGVLKSGSKHVVMLCCLLLVLGGIFFTPNTKQITDQAYAAEDGVTDFVSRLYTEVLGREADEAGLSEWTAYLQNGTFSGVEVASGFIMSDEFLNKDMEHEEFVRIMYSAFFGREANTDELCAWVDYLEQGYRKSFVFSGFANSVEFGNLCESYGVTAGLYPVTITEQQPNLSDEEYNTWLFVERLYTEVLGRTPDMTGIKEWADYLQAGTYTGAEVSKGFIMSTEFQNKAMTNEDYVKIMYKAFFGREADQVGLEGWVNALETNYTKEFVFAGFANSVEFGNLCKAYGIEQGEVEVPQAAPKAPSSIANRIGGVHISWNATDGVKQYGVWRSENETGVYEWLGNVEETEFTDTSVESGTNYYYKLTSFDAEKEAHSSMSKSISIIYVDAPEITEIYNTKDGITIEWNAVEGATGYAIYVNNAHGTDEVIIEGNETHIWSDICFAQDEIKSYSIRALADKEMNVMSECSEEERTMRLLPVSTMTVPVLSIEKINCAFYNTGLNLNFFTEFETRLLLDSIEYKMDTDPPISGFGKNLNYVQYFCQQFTNAREFDALDGELTIQIRYKKEVDGIGTVYSAWSEEEKIITLSEMDAIIDDLATEITASAKSDFEKALAIYEWIMDNAEYALGHTFATNLVSYCEHLILNGEAVCEGYTDCFFVLAERVGLEVKKIEGLAIYENQSSHGWNQVKIDGKWYNLDVTWGDDIYGGDDNDKRLIKYIYFLTSDDTFYYDLDHDSYDLVGDVQECPDDYPVLEHIIQRDGGNNTIYAHNKEELQRKIEQKIEEGCEILNVYFLNNEENIPILDFEQMLNETIKDSDKIIVCTEAKDVLLPLGQLQMLYKTELAIYDLSAEDESTTSICIPESFSSIASGAFEGMSNIISIELPDSIKSIGERAFCGCSSLEKINIPDGIAKIESRTFQGCSSLKDITIPDSVKHISYFAFDGCSSLEKIVIPDKVNQIDAEAFSNCTSLKEVVILSDKIKELTGFRGCSSLKTFIIPESITSIAGYAFKDCSSLESIEIPEGITKINYYTFQNCTSLECISLPTSLEKIDTSAFEGCSSLTSIELPEGLTSIGSSAFYNCTGLVTVALPDSITQLGNSIFKNCTGLECIKLPKNLEKMEYNMFEGCSSLKNVELPEGLTSIGKYAFKNCTALTEIELPDGLTQIENSVFYNCTSLETVKLPDSLEKIGDSVFVKCSNLKSIELPEGLTSIGSSAFNATGLINIELPDGLTSLGENAFYNCTSLERIKLPNSLEKIESCTFSYCSSLTSIELPDGITSVGKDAFFTCTSLTSVTMSDGITSIGATPFRYCSILTSILVSPGTYAETWVKENYPTKIQYK